MRTIMQMLAVTGMAMRSLPARATASSVIVVGIAGVVTVLVAALSMSAGLTARLAGEANAQRVVVVRSGATSELGSLLTSEAAAFIAEAPGIERDAQGRALSSIENIIVLNLPRFDGVQAGAPVRGITPQSLSVRPEIKIVGGRMFEPSVTEMIVGKAAASLYNLSVGSSFTLSGVKWSIVGVFESGGDLHESELVANRDTLNSIYQRDNAVQSVTVKLSSTDAIKTLRAALAANPTLQVEAIPESEFLKMQTDGMRQLLTSIAFVVGGIMALGAVFAALNTMYSAVSSRTREIATLRALGFGAFPVVVSVVVEALFLALLGGAAGSALAYVAFDGFSTSTRNGLLGGQVAFDLSVTANLVVVGIFWACAIGLVGGLLPALRAGRLPVAVALRGS